ncbi:MAG TPA: DUF222 domain-containing protein [Frankiaceae bacterium]|nr:DUF222 domain-containing protein [Frankiaceae bacterium]
MAALPPAVVAFLDVDPCALSDADLGARIVVLETLVRRAQAAQAEAVRVFDRRDAADGDGAASTACWLRDRINAADGDARRTVGLARALDRLPATAAALRDGSITLAHARILTGQTRALPADTVTRGEPALVRWARDLNPQRFATVVRRWVATVAPAEFERDTERRYDTRWLTLSRTFGGMTAITGMLDPEAGTLLTGALDALVSANPTTDTRSRGQQRADALTDLATIATTHAALPVTGGHRPEIVVHIPATTLTATRATGGAGTGSAPATLDDGTPLTAAAFDRLACDATFRRLLLDAHAVPLELGRATRLIPSGLRKYVALRDGGCRYPGCPRPAAYCEAHHVTFWRHGGRTDAANLVLLCRYHHHLVHDRGHALTLDRDGTVRATRPAGATLTSRPRGPTAIPAA